MWRVEDTLSPQWHSAAPTMPQRITEQPNALPQCEKTLPAHHTLRRREVAASALRATVLCTPLSAWAGKGRR